MSAGSENATQMNPALTGLLSGAGGGLLYSLIAGDRKDGWRDHLRRAVIGAGLGGVAGYGYGALSRSGGGGSAPIYRDPDEVMYNVRTGGKIGTGLASGLVSRGMGSGIKGQLAHTMIGGLIGDSDIDPKKKLGLSALQGAGMGLLSPSGIARGATRGGNLKTRLANAGSGALYNAIASSLGSGAGQRIGALV